MNAAIIGYGKSGKAAENILKMNGFTDIVIFDDGNADAQKIADFKDEYDSVVVSPGINMKMMSNPPVNYTSEIELAHSKKPASAKVVAITGTNGKSTVTSLTAQIMNNCGVRSIACGNIGLPYADAVLSGDYGCFVVELSSFQTGLLKNFSAEVAIVTNLAEDHLDRYADMDEYADDKMNLLKFLDNDGRLIIENDKYLEDKVSFFKGETLKVELELEEWKLGFDGFFVDTRKFPLKGKHNLVNLSFALFAVDKLCGLKGDVTNLIENLKGLEHRCEHVADIKGVEYINDSKGTNIHSTLTALRGFDQGVIVILGGKDKNGDFTLLKDVINEKAAGVITYGGSGGKIYKTLDGAIKVPLYKAEKLEDAVQKAFEVAKVGQKVVLSPACASFDQHKNFEHRGAHFKELVHALRKEADERA